MRVKAYMAAYYLAHAVYQSYMSLFYRGRGLDAAQIGAVYALVAAASAAWAAREARAWLGCIAGGLDKLASSSTLR